jgi:disulfide bond formation protein DsbB
MTRNGWIILATVGSLSLMLGAWGFEYIGGYPPCKLCYWQRWPHLAAIAIGVIALLGLPWLAWFGALAAATTSGIGIYHTGVERAWWQGPTSCTSSGIDLGAMTGADLLAIEGPKLVLCDEVAWALFGMSMASWNAVFSGILLIFWLRAARSPF